MCGRILSNEEDFGELTARFSLLLDSSTSRPTKGSEVGSRSVLLYFEV